MTEQDRGALLRRITVDPTILVGKPVIRGMRLSAAQVVSAVAAGISYEELLEEYPGLEIEDIRAALLYAADVLGSKRFTSVDYHF